MNLKNLSDEHLITELKSLVARERETTLEILHRIREVATRRLYALRGYPSLFEFVVQELGYSESAAQCRIASMRLNKDLPQLEEKITAGALTLTNLSKVQSVVRQLGKNKNRKITRGEKIRLLEKIENQSTRQCEKILAAEFPDAVIRPESRRSITQELTEISAAGKSPSKTSTLQRATRARPCKRDNGRSHRRRHGSRP